MEEEIQNLRWQHSNQFVEEKMKNDLHLGLEPLPWSPQIEILLCWCG